VAEMTYVVRFRCQFCGRRETQELSTPLGPGEGLVFRHTCSDSWSSPFLLDGVRRG